MKRLLWTIAVLACVGLLPTFAANRPAATTETAPSATIRCLYLPLIKGGTRSTTSAAAPAQSAANPCSPTNATATPTRTNTPAPSATPTGTVAPRSYNLSGTVGVYPRGTDTVEVRAPLQLLFVLDVSGSLSSNSLGQCNNTGTVVQCAPGPAGSPAPTVNGVGTSAWWNPAEERQIAIVKNSLQGLIEQLNMPGNVGYNPELPSDEVAVVWFHHQQTPSMARNWSSDPATLKNAVLQAGSYNGDNYRTNGGTNGAAGLYRAALLLKNRQRTTTYNNQQFTYRRGVLFMSDGLSKDFFDPIKADLNGGESGPDTYSMGSQCRGLGAGVYNSPACQTTEVGGEAPGKWNHDRPITQMIRVANDFIKNDPNQHAEIFALTPVDIGGTGLRDGVASYPTLFYPLTKDNASVVIDAVLTRLKEPTEPGCVNVNGSLVTNFGPDNAGSFPPANWQYPVVGQVTLTDQQSGAQRSANVIAGAGPNGANSYLFNNLPAGTYTLRSAVAYRATVSDALRLYDQIEADNSSQQSISITLGPADPAVVELPLQLFSNENACSGQ